MSNALRVAGFISGSGTTLAAIIEATKTGPLVGRVEVALVIASRPDAGGFKKAIEAGIPEKDVLVRNPSPKYWPSPEAFGEMLIEECKNRGIDAFGQYGWMPKTPKNFVEAYAGKGINQHPGPLDPGRPDFGGEGMYGMRVHAAVLNFARKANRSSFVSEATAQWVHPEFDRGEVILREYVVLREDDTPESLQKRILPIEHRLQINALLALSMNEARSHPNLQPLIREYEHVILLEAKDLAKKEYPKG